MAGADPTSPATRPAQDALLASLRAGDPAVTEAWVRSQLPRMRAVANRLLRSESAADDAVQEAFMRAFRALPDFRGEAALETWLHRIVVNAALGRLRKVGRAGEVELDQAGPEYTDDGQFLPGEGRAWGAVEGLLQREETRECVRRMIDGLPETSRTVLILRDIEELSTAEAAEVLGVSTTVVKTRLHRARLALKRAIENQLTVEPQP